MSRILYGLPYKGSKTKIADDILEVLPDGKRFIDLFGGGFAMSHAALLSGKYKTVLYNDIEPLVVNLVKDAIAGKYNYNVFKPEFITREKFDELKDIDGYIKYIWSFGNNGKDYLFCKGKEHIKHIAHDFVVFGKWNSELDKIIPSAKLIKTNNISKRRKMFCYTVKKENNKYKRFYLQRLQQLEQLERLERLEQLERLERLERLEHLKLKISNKSYEKYKYKTGDVVYCDIPYQNTSQYGTEFDHEGFYNWCDTRDYPVYFSSYEMHDDRFELIWARQLRSTYSQRNDITVNYECLYKNKHN